jgi:hypothetical protein
MISLQGLHLACCARRGLTPFLEQIEAPEADFSAFFLISDTQDPETPLAVPCATRTHPGQGGELWCCKAEGALTLQARWFARYRRRE